MSSAIEAGVSTIFVGLGEDPQVLAVRAPELFAVSCFCFFSIFLPCAADLSPDDPNPLSSSCGWSAQGVEMVPL